MTTFITRIAFLAAALPVLSLADASQEATQEHGWDCPGSGYLPFRRELLVSTEELAQWIETAEVDVIHVGFESDGLSRTRRAAYADGHLPGARYLSWTDLQGPTHTLRPAMGRWPALAALGISPGRRVVLYDTGLGLEAAAAFVALESVGLADRAALLDGQWIKWVCEGRPLCRWTAKSDPSDGEPRTPDLALSAAEVESRIRAPESAVSILNARAGADRKPSGPMPILRMPWTENLASLLLPLLKGENELRRGWRAIPARPDQQVIIGARDWKESAPVYFVARLLGYSARVLDDSIDDLESSLEVPERGP